MTQGNLLCFTNFGQEFATFVFLRFPVHNISWSGTFSGTFESQNSQQLKKCLVIKNTLDLIVLLYIYLVKKKCRKSIGRV